MQLGTRRGGSSAVARFAIVLAVTTYLVLFAIAQVGRSLEPGAAVPTLGPTAATPTRPGGGSAGAPGPAARGPGQALGQPGVAGRSPAGSDGPVALTRPVHLRLASGELGTAWYFLAAALARPIGAALPEGSTVDVLPFAGAVHNAEKLTGGEAELALALHNTARWAYEGRVAYDRARPGLRGLAGGLGPAYVVVAATQEAARRWRLTRLGDVAAGKLPVKLVTASRGDGGEVVARLTLQAHGLDYARIRRFGGEVTHTSLSVVPTLLRDGRADVFIHVAPPGQPTLSELGVSAGLVYLALDEAAVAKLAGAYGFLPLEIPAGTFPGQAAAVPTAGAMTVLLAHETLPYAVAYRVTRAVIEAAPQLARAHPAVAAFVPEAAWRDERLGVPLHPGAASYYAERGWFRPEAGDPVLGGP